MKLVAVSQRCDHYPERQEIRDALDRRLVQFIEAIGGLGIPVPNYPEALPAWLAHLRPDAIVLSGGNDLGAVPDRDHTEQGLLKYAQEHSLPLLGICRGMQMMATNAGAPLIKVAGHVAHHHPIRGEITQIVNSYHAWGLATAPDTYRILARAPDGTIEAIGHLDLPWEGWMWHPERQAPFAPDDLARATKLLIQNRL
ncbi:putative glutamine amidotransferase [Oryzomicrobium terrae]|uniref:Putative glutamine amidotransferase n=1 Tax=Oryzomicrobium terrae TaxID=1735038 RepID=A0A5C1E743_9RHOO|nr:gamma-glutamyl-gamma-aminobutyrate hydrolase family protein [Oryzomicrobium terrae]QEL64409.1 putative glutamine amidotransferase [Oryzomicrobium terrae]